MEQSWNDNGGLSERVREHVKPRANILDHGVGLEKLARRLSEAGYGVTCVKPDGAAALRPLTE